VSKADLNKKPAEVAAMFDDVAVSYDKTNDLLSFGQARLWRKSVADAVSAQSGQAILDIAAGTGTSSMAFLKPGVRVVAADFSKGMQAEGKKRFPELEFVFADAMKLPFADKEFDAVTISFGLRNVENHKVALGEFYRVLKPGGKLVVCEFSYVPGILGPFYRFYLAKLLPIFSRVFSKTPEAYSYLAESIAAWPRQADLKSDIEVAGFKDVTYKNLTLGIVCMHQGLKS
jgi:demethylmenaquinone methyltransferase/2-methoxy-6-polyprenyl-1,4-benzoquinol methylase